MLGKFSLIPPSNPALCSIKRNYDQPWGRLVPLVRTFQGQAVGESKTVSVGVSFLFLILARGNVFCFVLFLLIFWFFRKKGRGREREKEKTI